MPETIALEEFPALASHAVEPSDWFEISQKRVNQFADATNDHQFIHVKPLKAKFTPFGGTIAHGFLTLSLLSKMCEGNGVVPEKVLMGLNYGFDKVRFLAPVKSGKRVRANCEIADITAKEGDRFLIKQAISVEIEGEETPVRIDREAGAGRRGAAVARGDEILAPRRGPAPPWRRPSRPPSCGSRG